MVNEQPLRTCEVARRRCTARCAVAAVVAVVWAPVSSAQTSEPPFQPAADSLCELSMTRVPATPLRIVVIGDFGDYEDRSPSALSAPSLEVLRAIEARHTNLETRYDLGLTVGDNFYPRGVTSIEDHHRRWKPYERLGIPFLATLGNHDYWRGRARTQVRYTSSRLNAEGGYTWFLPCRFYSVAAGPVHLVGIDTDEGTIGVFSRLVRLLTFRFREPAWSEQQGAWLDGQLARSSGAWTLVYGHHPVFSVGQHGDTGRLKTGPSALLPILERRGVAAYLAGHDHSLQHLRVSDLDFFIVGGGGRSATGAACRGNPSCRFADERHGFMELEVTSDRLQYTFIDAKGQTVYRGELLK